MERRSRLEMIIYFYSRDDDYGWLSNFWRANQIVDGAVYPTNEHFYQSQKSIDYTVRGWIRSAPNPFLAMKAGRSLRSGKELRPDWENLKLGVMEKGLKAKFFQNEDLKQKLIETGSSLLRENSPTDMFWGGALNGSKNMLGELLMKIRKEFSVKVGEIQ